MRSIYSPYAEARPSVLHQKHSVGGEALTIARSHSEQNHLQSWRRIAYRAVLLSTLFLGALAWLRRDFRNPEISDWKPVLALADTAQEKGDLYYAESLYSEVGRRAALREDWAGLVAAACAMNKLDKQKGRYSPTNALLLRANGRPINPQKAKAPNGSPLKNVFVCCASAGMESANTISTTRESE